MKRLAQRLNVEWILRTSLGLMYFWSGIDLLRYSTAWYWAVRPLPMIVQNVINKIGIDQYLKIQGIGELALAGILLFKFVPRVAVLIVAGITVIEMAGILLFVGVDAITFRDIGLLGAALALYVILVGGSEKPKDKQPKSTILAENKSSEPKVETYDQFMKH